MLLSLESCQASTAPIDQEPTAQRICGRSLDLVCDDPTRRPAPVAVRVALHISVSRGRIVSPLTDNGVTLMMWVIRGRCIINGAGRRLSVGPGQVAICLPTMSDHAMCLSTSEHQLCAVADSTEIIGVGIEGNLAWQFMRELNLGTGVYPYGSAPVDQVRDLMNSLKDASCCGRQHSSMLAIAAIYGMADAICGKGAPAVIQQARQTIQQEFANPSLTCEIIAAKVGCSGSYFRRIFRQYTGCTVMKYLTQVRLREAQSLIGQSDHKVAEIAQMCGFRGASYFARWLRKHTGYRPGEWRAACCTNQA